MNLKMLFHQMFFIVVYYPREIPIGNTVNQYKLVGGSNLLSFFAA